MFVGMKIALSSQSHHILVEPALTVRLLSTMQILRLRWRRLVQFQRSLLFCRRHLF
jgi:hypothetical protein